MERVPKHDTYIPQRPRTATWIRQPDINRLDLSTLVCYSIGAPRQMFWLLQFIVHPDVIVTVNVLTLLDGPFFTLLGRSLPSRSAKILHTLLCGTPFSALFSEFVRIVLRKEMVARALLAAISSFVTRVLDLLNINVMSDGGTIVQ